jgi:hypothetical protein
MLILSFELVLVFETGGGKRMPFMIHADHDNRVIYQKVRGVYNASHLTEANAHIKSIESAWDYSMLIDCLDMRQMDVPEAFLEELGHKIRNEIPVRLRAIVAPPRYTDQIQSFADYSANAFQNVRVFSDLTTACDWLLITEDDLRTNCLGYRPVNTFYDSESDHWTYQNPASTSTLNLG